MSFNKFSDICKHTFSDWNYIFKSELKNIFKDKGVLIFCVLLPLLYPPLYTWIYNNEVVHNVPTVVVDDSRSSLSREYIRKVDATPEVEIIAHVPDMASAKRMIQHREVYGIMYIPKTFEKDIIESRQTHVSIFIDMSGLLYYKALLMANSNVSLDMNAKIRMDKHSSESDEQKELAAHRIPYTQVDIYNPQTGFASFLIPAVLVLILQQALVLGIGLSAGTAREKNTYRELMPVNRHYNGLLRIVLGKALAYVVVFIPNIIYVLGVVPHFFSLPQIGSELDIYRVMIPFILAVVFFGMTLSVLIRQRETSFMIVVFTSVPLLFMSGISWPAPAIPDFWRYISYCFPSTFGINAYVKINSLGGNMTDVKTEWIALWIQAIFYFSTTLLVYRNNIHASRKRFIALYKQKKERRKSLS